MKLSSRYISRRQLPDKAVSLLDTTCARIGLSQSSTPPQVEDCQRRMEQRRVAMDILRREEEMGADHHEQLAELEQQQERDEAELKKQQERWQTEKDLVARIRQLADRLQGIAAKPEPGAGRFFMISVVAKAYGIHPQTLRLYEREGLLKPSRTDGNTRLYSEEDLKQPRSSLPRPSRPAPRRSRR